MNFALTNHGLGTKNYPDHSKIEFAPLTQYLDWTNELLDRYAPQLLNSEDAISHIANSMMIADWTYKEGIGTRRGWRRCRAFFSILTFKTCVYRQKKSVPGCVEDAVDSRPGPLDELCSREDKKNVLNFIGTAGLSQKQGSYIVMKYVDGLTQTEIAQACGVSKQYISQQIKQSLKKIKEDLNGG